MEIGLHKNRQIQIYLNQWLWYKQNKDSYSYTKLPFLNVPFELHISSCPVKMEKNGRSGHGKKTTPGNEQNKDQQDYKKLGLSKRALIHLLW